MMDDLADDYDDTSCPSVILQAGNMSISVPFENCNAFIPLLQFYFVFLDLGFCFGCPTSYVQLSSESSWWV